MRKNISECIKISPCQLLGIYLSTTRENSRANVLGKGQTAPRTGLGDGKTAVNKDRCGPKSHGDGGLERGSCGPIRPPAWTCKYSFIEKQSHPLIHKLSMVAFMF